MNPVPTKTQLSNFLGTPGEDYFKGNPKSLNFYFLVIWWGKSLQLMKIPSLKLTAKAPENRGPLEKEIPIGNPPFLGANC